MGYIYKEVEVDVETTVYQDLEITDDDVVDYLREYPKEIEDILRRINHDNKNKDIISMALEINYTSMEDELKLKVLIDAYKKYNLTELEEIFKK